MSSLVEEPAFVLGVDAGGSHTRAAVMDEAGRVLGRGVAGPGTAEYGDVLAATESIRSACLAALSDADRVGPARHLAVGAAGVGLHDHRVGLRAALAALALASTVTVVTDAEVAHYDAFGSGGGILLIAGTGSVAMGRVDGGDSLRRVGGWGGLIGDEGSGYAIGLSALRAVARSVDGRGPETELFTLLADRAEAGERQLLFRMARGSKSEVAALAPTVMEASEKGDSVARRIVEEAVEALVEQVDALARVLEFENPGPVALVGGLVALGGPLRPALVAELRARAFSVVEEVDPTRGAARLALSKAKSKSAPPAEPASPGDDADSAEGPNSYP